MSTPVGLPPRLERRLRRIVGREELVTGADRLLAYEADALTTVSGRPRAAVLPGTREEVRAVVRCLHEAGVPLVPRGAGTGLAGGAVARGEIIVGTSRLRRILELDPVERTASVEPGVITAEVSRAAAPYGLRYLPDPASASACTIGGNIAMNSGGPHCLKHGVTTDHVAEVEVVLPDGSDATLRRGEDGGLDLAGLFIGSEGTLGIATRITVRLSPVPEAVRTLLALFDDLGRAGDAVSRVIASGTIPVALELIDAATIAAVEESVYAAGLPRDVAAALVIECEGGPDEVAADIGRIEMLLRESGARELRTARDEAERAALWHARKKAYGALGRLAPDILVQDAVVPRTRLSALLPAIADVAREHGLPLANFFHAGDGNLHPNLLFDHRSKEAVRRVEAASAEIMRLCVEAGGTITGEHGVGLDKIRYMGLVFGPDELADLRSVKRAFDPVGRCNPGKLLPPPRDGWSEPTTCPPTPAGPPPAPDGWFEPGSEEEIARWVQERALDGTVPLITGAAAPPEWLDPDVAVLSTCRLGSVLDFRPDDLTVRVEAGMRVSHLMERLEADGRWLPLEGGARRLSVGGLVAAAPAGALDALFGPLRRHVLAATVVSPDGRARHWGRAVMKNVAGYDMVRLLCGSRGRLGVLTAVTFRLWPRPASDLSFELSGGPGPEALAAAMTVATDPAPGDGALRWRWRAESGAAPDESLEVRILGPTAVAEARREAVERWARARGAEMRAVAAGDDGPREHPHPADRRDRRVFRFSPGRRYLFETIHAMRERAGSKALRMEAFPALGRFRLELGTGDDAGGDSAGDGIPPSPPDQGAAEIARRLAEELGAWSVHALSDRL
ncbi:MAG: FAD-binding oxidoreductase [Gemmatimonadota bacterium]